MSDQRRYAPAAGRNRTAISAALGARVASDASFLEIASGTGEHGAFVCHEQTGFRWQPSERTTENFASIAAWSAELKARQVAAPIIVDVERDPPWVDQTFDAVFNANMIHIAPWTVCLGLLTGGAYHLHPGGRLFVYGPFRVAGEHTAPSNAQFDASLRGQNSHWGVRDLEAVEAAANERQLRLRECIPMPANNQMLMFEKVGD